jgi:hypothetical protein
MVGCVVHGEEHEVIQLPRTVQFEDAVVWRHDEL